jgi:hypothetical protein
MAEAKTEPAPAAAAEGGSGENHQQQKTVVVVGVDDSDHSYHALEWTVRHVAAGMAGAADLVIVHAKPSPSSVVSFGGPGMYASPTKPPPLGPSSCLVPPSESRARASCKSD